MSSSGAAMNGLTVPARSATGEDCPRSGVCSAPCPECPESQSAQKVRVLRKSVDGLSDRLDICRLVCAQPIVVML
jgi:hypothetical protein